MMQHALHYLRMGFPVIPLKPKSKEPLILWTEFQKRLPAEAEVRSWWQKWPSANVGLVTGSVAGIAVVDLDGLVGIAEGQRLGLMSPAISQTGNGQQLFYKHTGGTICNAVKKYPGIDIRGDGGYVVAPPSWHPNGKRYQWLGAGNVALGSHLPPFPTALFTATPAARLLRTDTKPGLDVAKALTEMHQGNIDITLFKVCSKLRGQGWTEEDAKVLLQPHADRAGATPGHLDDKIRNCWTRYESNERPQSAHVDEPTAESVEVFMEAQAPVTWICRPLIANAAIGFVAGLPETSKTWLLIDLAIECARGGGTWLDLFPVQDAKVLFIDQERAKSETQRRVNLVAAHKGVTFQSIKNRLFLRCGTTTRLDLTPSYEAFRRELLEIKPDLVIIDSWAAFQTVDENSRGSVQTVIERLKTLRNEIGCAFVFIDHENKSVFTDMENNETPSAYRMVGSVGKVAAAEFVLTVRRFDDDSVLVHHTKSTLAERAKSFMARVVNTEKGVRVYGEGAKDA